MVRIVLVLILGAVGNRALAAGQGAVDTSKSPHVKLRSLPMGDVKWTDASAPPALQRPPRVFFCLVVAYSNSVIHSCRRCLS